MAGTTGLGEGGGMVVRTRKSLDFYLVQERPLEPWGSARYHSNTSANMYSKVHWSYFPNGREGQRHASSVVQLSFEDAVTMLGDAGKAGKYVKSG